MTQPKPACMSPDEYTSWAEQNQALYLLSDRATTPCHDCIASFAVEQRAIDRCDGEPGGHATPPMTIEERNRLAYEAKRRNKEANIRRAAELWERGLLQKQIAAEMGASVSGVGKWLRAWRAAA